MEEEQRMEIEVRNAAVFVDFENIYFGFLHQGDQNDQKQAMEDVLQLLGGLRHALKARGGNLVLGRSYSSFDEFPGAEAALPLSLMGFDPQYVVKYRGKNSADLTLSLDLLEVLLTRPDIGLFVIVGGDRDYIPVSRKVLESGRELLIISMEEATSGDLVDRVGTERFMDARAVLEEALRADAATAEQRANGDAFGTGLVEKEAEAAGRGPDGADDRLPRRGRLPRPVRGARILGHLAEVRRRSRWAPVDDEEALSDENQRSLVRLLEELTNKYLEKSNSNEIWLGPLLKREMADSFPRLTHPQRRKLINLLRDKEAVRIEERQSHTGPHPYSVVILNKDHPLVRETIGG